MFSRKGGSTTHGVQLSSAHIAETEPLLQRSIYMSVTMSSASAVGDQSIAVPTDVVWRFSVDQYHTMIRMGILTEDDPVELLEGWLIVKMSKSPKHRVATRLIRQALEHSVPPGWYVDSQEPLTTADSEPEPDVMIVRGETRQ